MNVETISALEGFLKWGSTGLAGLMLVLVIIAIIGRDISVARKSLLRTFMFIGAFCFVASLAAEVYLQTNSNEGRHKVILSVLPNDLDGSDFPPPLIKKDGAQIDRTTELFVAETTVLSIDVSGAVGLFRTTAQRADAAQEEAAQAQVTLAAVTQDATEARQQAERSAAMVQDLREETEAKNAELAAVEAEITRQEDELRAIASRNSTLARRVQTLSTSDAPSAPAIRSIEREINSINRSLQGVFR